jgi:hypothetical protein
MCRSKILFVLFGLVAVCALSLGVSAANATVITVPLLNPSFESPNISPEPYLAVTPDNWTLASSGGTGVYVKRGGTPPNGSQYAEVASTAYLWQNTGFVLQTGDTVTLSAYAQHDSPSGTSKLKLMVYDANDSSTLGTAFLGDNIAMTDTWAGPYTVSGVCDSSVNGKYVTVAVGGATAQWADIDAVSLTVLREPEPSVVVLLVTGLLGLLCYAWRKRR